MRKIIIFILSLISLNIYAQKHADKSYYLIDSLSLNELSDEYKSLIESSLKIFHNSNSDTVKVQSIEYIVENCWDENVWPKYNLWLYSFLEEKIQTSNDKKTKYSLKKSLASATSNIGYDHGQKGNISLQVEFYFKALSMLLELNDEAGVASLLNNIGYIYFSQGNIQKALNFYDRSLKIRQELNDQNGIAQSYNNIAYVYDTQKDNEKALDFYTQSLNIYQSIKNVQGVASTLNNIAYIKLSEGNDSIALENFRTSYLIRVSYGDNYAISQSLNNIGMVFRINGDLDSALYYFQASLKIKEEIFFKQGIAVSLNNIGAVELIKGNFKLAEKYCEKSLRLGQELGYPDEIQKSAKILSIVYEKQNKGMLAFEMYKLYNVMHDSINNLSTQKAAIQQQAKYAYEKQKVLDDAENEKLLAIEKEEKQKQKVLSASIGIGLLLLIGFFIFVFNRLRVTKKQKKLIENQKLEVEEQKEIIEETHKEITDSINYAKRLQNAILPSIPNVNKYLPNNFIYYNPKDVVSGDFYWFEQIKGVSYFAVADCTGHGVPGAMVSVVCSNALNRSVKEFGITEPSKILDKTRELVIETFAKSGGKVKDGMDISLCAIDGVRVIYSGANNPLWVVKTISFVSEIELTQKSTCVQGDKVLIEYKANKQPIGLYEKMTNFNQTEISLNRGDILYLFTDGFADQFGGEKGKKFKYKPFKKMLLNIAENTMSDQEEMLNSTFNNWKNSIEQIDDVCIVGIKL